MPLDVLAYLRVSTAEQGRSGLGLEAQRGAIAAEASARGWHVADWITDTASGSSLEREGIRTALNRLENGGPKVLVAAKLDRLSRSAIDFLGLVERAQRNGWDIVLLEPRVDMTDAMGRFTAGVLAQVAQLERELIGQRTSEALARARERGQRLGRPIALPHDVRAEVADLRGKGLSLRAIADRLASEGIPTAHGGAKWHASTVQAVLRSIDIDRSTDLSVPTQLRSPAP